MADVHGMTSQADAARTLQASILTAVGAIAFPAGLATTNAEIVTAVRQNLDAISFDKHNQELRIVEGHAAFTATRADGTHVFTLLIIWDADVPPPGSAQTAHFGWEIYLNGHRVAGPSHVFFVAGLTLKYYRMPGYNQAEELSLKLTKSGTIGTGRLASETNYYKLVQQ